MRAWRLRSGCISHAMTTGGSCSARSTGSRRLARRTFGGGRTRRFFRITGRGGGGEKGPAPPPHKGEKYCGGFWVLPKRKPQKKTPLVFFVFALALAVFI